MKQTLKYILTLPLSLFAVSSNVQANPEISTWETKNGVSVYFVEAPEIPMIDVRIVFRAGSARDGKQLGIANLTAGLMNDGAGDYDADEFSDRLADTGAKFGAGAMRDMAWLSLRTLIDDKYSIPALELMRLVVSQPRFDQTSIERSKTAIISSIKRDLSSPGRVANKAASKAIFGTHPYSHTASGTEKTVGAISKQQIVAFHAKYYVADNAIIALVGAIDRSRAETLAEALSAELPRGARAGEIPPVSDLATSTQHIEFDSIQSHVRVGLPGMKRGDPDYVPLFVGNHVLGGGGLVSLLFDEVREKRGLSYSVNSFFSPLAERGMFIASLQTDGSQAADALNVLTETINTFVQDGPPAERLVAAKQNLIGGFPLRIDSNSKILEYISMIGFYGLPLDYLETFPKRVAEVTAEDIKDAFGRRVDLSKAATIVVGRKQ